MPPPVIIERIHAAGIEAKDAAIQAMKTAPASALNDESKPVPQLVASAFMAYHTSRLFGSYTEMAIDYWQLRNGSKDESVSRHLLEKMDETAIEWSIIGKIGGKWFPSRMKPSVAEGCWRKYAERLKKHLKIEYAGPDAAKIVVEPEVTM